MNRLYTFGCSYTSWNWPTWADIMSLEANYYENWGHAGLGNRAIAERVAECNIKNKFNHKDQVVVQWTSHLRHDWHATDNRHQDNAGWKTSGSIFNYINSKVFTDNWIKTFWDENSYVMHMLHNIILAKGLLETIGCNWYMTSMGEIEKMNSDYPGVDMGEIGSNNNIWNDIPGLSIYKDLILDNKDKWIDPIGTITWNSGEPGYKFKKEDLINWYYDQHPSIEQHAYYLQNYVKPKIKNSQDLSKKSKDWIDKVNNAYDNCRHDFDRFVQAISKEIGTWDNYYRGF